MKDAPRVRHPSESRRPAARTVVPAAALAAAVVLACAAPALGAGSDGTIGTVAGGLFQPRGIAHESSGSNLIVEFGGHRLRRVAGNGGLKTLAGVGGAGFSGDGGPASASQLNGVTDVIVMPSGPYQGTLLADEFNHRIRRIDPSGIITTVAGTGTPGSAGDGGDALLAELQNPRALSANPDGGFLIADEFNNRIRQVGPDGIITTVAGTGAAGAGGNGGPATSASLRRPLGVLSLGAGHFLIADGYNNCVREVEGGVISRVAGACGQEGFRGDGGRAIDSLLYRPRDIVRSADGGYYIADSLNMRVRRISPDGVISTVAGSGVLGGGGDGGPAIEAQLDEPSNLFVESSGDLLVADTENGRLRRVQHPLPVIGTLSPVKVAADGVPVAVVVSGAGFPQSAVGLWKGAPRPTTWIDSTHVSVTLSGADLAAPGNGAISVRAGQAGGDTTAAKTLIIGPRSPNPPPPPPPAPTPAPGATPVVPPSQISSVPPGVAPAPAPARLRIRISVPKRVHEGDRFPLIVRISGPLGGRRVVVQRRVGASFRTASGPAIRAALARRSLMARRSPGRMLVRVVAIGRGGRVTSAAVTVRVVR